MVNTLNHRKVSAVIINWNCYKDTLECVTALKNSTYPNIEIIVVDNASADDSLQKIEQNISGIILIKSKENLGWAGGSRLGTQDALARGADYIFLLNADAFVEPDTVEKLVRKAESATDIGIVSAVLYYFNSRRLQHCGAQIDWEKCTMHESESIEQGAQIPPDKLWVWFTAALFKRQVIEKIGLYEERYFCYSEDVEYSLRTHRAGFKIAVVPDAKVFHRCHEIDTAGAKNMPAYFYFYMTRNEFFFFRKYSPYRIGFYPRFLARVFIEAAHDQYKGNIELVDARLDGLYCGFKNISGRWDKTRKMPKWIKSIIMARVFLWADILKGDFKEILRQIVRRINVMRYFSGR